MITIQHVEHLVVMLPPSALYLTFLAPQIASVFHRGFGAGDIERGVERIGLEQGQPVLRQQIGKADSRLTQ